MWLQELGHVRGEMIVENHHAQTLLQGFNDNWTSEVHHHIHNNFIKNFPTNAHTGPCGELTTRPGVDSAFTHVISTLKTPLVLGYLWLCHHNPQIDWIQGKVLVCILTLSIVSISLCVPRWYSSFPQVS